MKSFYRQVLTISLFLFSTSLFAQNNTLLEDAAKRFDKSVTNQRPPLWNGSTQGVHTLENKPSNVTLDPRLLSTEKGPLLKKLRKHSEDSLYNLKPRTFDQYQESRTKNNGGWGGGTGVLRANKPPVLYDLYMTRPDFEDTYNIRPNLPVTPFLKRLGYEYIEVSQLPEYQALLQLLDSWSPKAFGLVQMIKDSLKNFKVSYTSVPLQRIDGLVLIEPLRQGDSLEPVIVYNSEIGARINYQLWNQLGDRSRIAALLHESFRNYQISMNFHHDEKDFDLNIQRITNVLVMQDPRDLSGYLDYTHFFGSSMLDYLGGLECASLSLRDYITLFQPELMANPTYRKNIEKNLADPAFVASWKTQGAKEAEESSVFKRDQQIKGLLTPQPEIAEIKNMELRVRRGIDEGVDPRSDQGRLLEVQIKGLRLINNFLQTRWLDDNYFGIWTDVKHLMTWQLQSPREDIFGNLKKYQKNLLTNFLLPIDKIQSRNVTELEKEKAKHDKVHEEWLDEQLRKSFSK